MNKWKDDGWRVATWMWIAFIFILFGCAIYWSALSKTPDMPFSAWLAQSSRDDVWMFGFGMIATGVAAGRFMSGGTRSK